MESFANLRRRTTDLLQSLPHSLPSLPSAARATGVRGTWERIGVPPIPRSSHSVDIVGATAYIFGGEDAAGHLADNVMHAVVLPSSGAPADYYTIKPVAASTSGAAASAAAPPSSAVPVPVVIEPSASDDKGKGLDDVSLASPPPAPAAAPEASPSAKGKEPESFPLPPPKRESVPTARAGHATAVIGSRIFMFGGRGGPDSAPLEERGRVWVFDTRASSWSFLDPDSPASVTSPVASPVGLQTPTVPSPRSDHSAVATNKPNEFAPKVPRGSETWKDWALGDSAVVGIPQRPIVGNIAAMATDEESDGYGTLLVHGGSLAGGQRSNEAWAFDVRTRVWRRLPSAPGSPRAGSSLAISKSCLYRFGGFNGKSEEGDRLDLLALGVDSLDVRGGHREVALSTAESWKAISDAARHSDAEVGDEEAGQPLAGQTSWPGPRSAAGLEAVHVGGGREYLVLVAGERSPSGGGAPGEGVGQFWDDVWAFQAAPQGMTAASVTDALLQAVGRDSGEGKWYKVHMEAFDDEDEASADGPGPRGRLAAAAYPEENALVLWGGVGAENRRLGDGWILRLG